MILKHKFVNYIPEDIEECVIYISIPFETVIHKCCCGCGCEVVTPLSPSDWSLIFDGETISLEPSIGNWSFICQSHYWISKSEVVWSNKLSLKRIEEVRKKDFEAKAEHLIKGKRKTEISLNEIQTHKANLNNFWKRLISFFTKYK